MTSFRPHGKWGDFLAAIIPALWCMNILTNSNFILRLIEWQNESSLFTVRVRARQWYWIYKYELKTFTDVLSAPKNVGSNKWVLNFFGDLQVADDYIHVLQMRRNSKWIKNYWASAASKLSETKNTIELGLNEVSRAAFFKNSNISYSDALLTSDNSSGFYKLLSLKNPTNKHLDPFSNVLYFNNKFKTLFNFDDSSFFFSTATPSNNYNLLSYKNLFFFYNNFINKNFYDLNLNGSSYNVASSKIFNDFSEVSRFVKKTQGLKLPFRLVKNFISFENDNFKEDSYFKTFFGDGLSKLEEKNPSNTTFLVLKQKKYSRKDNIAPTVVNDEHNGRVVRYSGRTILLNNSIFHEYISDPNTAYRLIKKNKKRTEVIPTTLAKRLLRVKRTLVLPAHINITLITNSFDIVHSWFIPGLGIKLDCVPGRSTHHTFYIDNVGFYFGQCAEICGRYHHHMPIRVCALPFEHFLVWWNVFGISRLSAVNKKNYERQLFVTSKYAW